MTNSSSANLPRVLAAVDLGSNSFHMVVARYEDGHLTLVDRIREMVRLAEGLDEHQNLSENVQERALACLARFGERLNSFHPNDVAVAGTNTLRKARNGADFLARAEPILGHPIDIISGLEEARLVYLGVAHSVPPAKENRLVVDIGGGSTELIVGHDFNADRMYSLFMGCVSISKRFFPDGVITAENIKAAKLAVDLEIRPVIEPLRELGWRRAFGSSGTIRTIDRILQARDEHSTGITRAALRSLEQEALEYGHADAIPWLANHERRRPVFIGGLVVLERVFKALKLSSMNAADYALREGLLYDTIGHYSGEDARERSVRQLCRRYEVNDIQARRFEEAALALFREVKDAWNLPHLAARNLLRWASRLHETGLTIAHSHYHRHGAYVVANSNLPGFSRAIQRRTAWLIEGHRQRIPMVDEQEANQWKVHMPRLLVIMRIAAVLVRGRKSRELPKMTATATVQGLALTLQSDWLSEHPLTRAALEQEQLRQQSNGFDFTFN